MHLDTGTAACRDSSQGGGSRISGRGVILSAVHLVVIVGLITFAAGSGPSAQASVPAGSFARPVAYVNATPIMSDRLELAVNALIPQQSFHRTVKADTLAEIRRTALERLVDDELQYQDAVARGLAVPGADVETGMRDVAARYPTAEAFVDAVRRAHMTMPLVRAEVWRTVLIWRAHEAAVTSQCGVTEAETAAFFEAHRDHFVVPEELHVQAITIGVDPSSPPAAWSAAKSRAQDVRRRLLAGATFEAMAREYSTDPNREQGGDMGYFHRGSLADQFEQATAALGIGPVSRVVQTIYGYHLVRIVDVRPSRQKAFAEVSADLRRDLAEKRCAELNDTWLGQLRASASVRYVDLAANDQPERTSPPGGTR